MVNPTTKYPHPIFHYFFIFLTFHSTKSTSHFLLLIRYVILKTIHIPLSWSYVIIELSVLGSFCCCLGVVWVFFAWFLVTEVVIWWVFLFFFFLLLPICLIVCRFGFEACSGHCLDPCFPWSCSLSINLLSKIKSRRLFLFAFLGIGFSVGC